MEREVDSGSMRFILLPPGETEYFSVAKRSFIDVNLNPIEHKMAIASDVLETMQVPADSVGFVPAGIDFRVMVKNFLPGLIVEILPEVWTDVFEAEFGIDQADIEFLSYERDPVAAELGRAGIRLLTEEHWSGERADSLALESIGMGLISRIARRFQEDRSVSTEKPMASALARQRQKAVLEYIEDRLNSSISLIDLASVANMSVSHFSRSFKLAIGSSPLRYVMYRRVTRAKLLLTDSNMSVAQVAHASGFSGQSHLTRVFKEFTGTTPAMFRRNA
ncbi:MAG: AraC family transcriptional regulator [Pseudomonadota bacterium]